MRLVAHALHPATAHHAARTVGAAYGKVTATPREGEHNTASHPCATHAMHCTHGLFAWGRLWWQTVECCKPRLLQECVCFGDVECIPRVCPRRTAHGPVSWERGPPPAQQEHLTSRHTHSRRRALSPPLRTTTKTGAIAAPGPWGGEGVWEWGCATRSSQPQTPPPPSLPVPTPTAGPPLQVPVCAHGSPFSPPPNPQHVHTIALYRTRTQVLYHKRLHAAGNAGPKQRAVRHGPLSLARFRVPLPHKVNGASGMWSWRCTCPRAPAAVEGDAEGDGTDAAATLGSEHGPGAALDPCPRHQAAAFVELVVVNRVRGCGWRRRRQGVPHRDASSQSWDCLSFTHERAAFVAGARLRGRCGCKGGCA